MPESEGLPLQASMGYVAAMSRDPAMKAEWLLMYRQGLEAPDIAWNCHTLPRTAEAFIREQVAQDPGLFDMRLCRCLEPSLPLFRPEDATRGWDGNLLSFSRFVQTHGSFPRRSADASSTAGALEIFLYHWARAQRAASAAGGLVARKERHLEAIPGWVVLGRDQINARYWDERLAACIAFIEKHNRLPSYRDGTTGHERTLGAWLSRQTARRHRGVLTAARSDNLDELLNAAGARAARRMAPSPMSK